MLYILSRAFTAGSRARCSNGSFLECSPPTEEARVRYPAGTCQSWDLQSLQYHFLANTERQVIFFINISYRCLLQDFFSTCSLSNIKTYRTWCWKDRPTLEQVPILFKFITTKPFSTFGNKVQFNTVCRKFPTQNIPRIFCWEKLLIHALTFEKHVQSNSRESLI